MPVITIVEFEKIAISNNYEDYIIPKNILTFRVLLRLTRITIKVNEILSTKLKFCKINRYLKHKGRTAVNSGVHFARINFPYTG